MEENHTLSLLAEGSMQCTLVPAHVVWYQRSAKVLAGDIYSSSYYRGTRSSAQHMIDLCIFHLSIFLTIMTIITYIYVSAT